MCGYAGNKETREHFHIVNLRSQKITNELIDSDTYDTSDCFHFSQKGHEPAAIELWNNMLRI
jgi:hypothetical protein